MVQMSGRKFPKRGDIYWVNLDPTVGGEIQKLRPGLIISNDIGNDVSSVVMVAPITSKLKHVYPFEVRIVLKGKNAKILLNQCRALDKSRLMDKIDEVNIEIMQQVEEAIRIVFGLNT